MNMKRRAFTLIELMAAVGMLGLIIAFMGIIFRFGIDVHRVSVANAEIMQKARTITEQLNHDLQGLRKDAPFLIWFREYPDDSNDRYDQVMFFSSGDFSSTQLYKDGEPWDVNSPVGTGVEIIKGNVARIQYALARGYDEGHKRYINAPFNFKNSYDRNLGRRVHILSSDGGLDDWPDANNMGSSIEDLHSSGELKNEILEHDRVSLSLWKSLDRNEYGAMGGRILNTCFDNPPLFNKQEPETYHNLLCERVGYFSIQWAYWDVESSSLSDANELRWFPDNDPDGDGNKGDSHFAIMKSEHSEITENKFGGVFNIRGNRHMNMWMPSDMHYYNTDTDDHFDEVFFPSALKFTFTVYDKKQVIEGGRTFTHIVYLDD